ncbi:hypothetical protein LCGC14_2315890 [marine sediment metagenome]|uniref:Uncharacterized protein n=1 Tax=marine sediment metagenome TaxID=412755 RepID=A0A0F9CJD2_9ZZZZ
MCFLIGFGPAAFWVVVEYSGDSNVMRFTAEHENRHGVPLFINPITGGYGYEE